MRVTLGKSRVRESRTPGSVRAKAEWLNYSTGTCPRCRIGINIDTHRLANAAEEIRRAIEHSPPETTIKFFR